MLIVGGFVMLAATGVIVLEVVVRQVVNVSIGGVDELAGYALAISSSWSFAAALLDKAHVRVDSLYLCFPRRARGWLDIVSLCGVLGLLVLIFRYSCDVLLDSAKFGSTSQTPLATPLVIPQSLWVLGLGWFVITTTALLIAAVRALIAGDMDSISRLAGTVTPEEEIRVELKDLERRQ